MAVISAELRHSCCWRRNVFMRYLPCKVKVLYAQHLAQKQEELQVVMAERPPLSLKTSVAEANLWMMP